MYAYLVLKNVCLISYSQDEWGCNLYLTCPLGVRHSLQTAFSHIQLLFLLQYYSENPTNSVR